MTSPATTTTVATVSLMGFTGALGVMVALILIGLLVAKQIAVAVPGERSARWARRLNLAIVPLVIAFVVIVTVKVASLA